jgi:IS5 family transposase
LAAVLDADNEGNEIWADSAYRSEHIEAELEVLGYISQIHERAYRNQPLSEDQIASNRTKSKTRAKVEHVFGAWVMTMGGKLVRCIGIERVRAQLGLKNLTYNRSADAHGGSLKRYVFWQKRSQA